MAQTAGGTYYAASSELVSSWPATSLDLANQLETRFAAKAPLASPALTGTPTAPTAAAGTNTTQIATTAFVQANGGTILIASASGSSAGSISMNNVLSSTYDVYIIEARLSGSATGGLLMRMRSSGTDNTTGYYWSYLGREHPVAGATLGTGANNDSSWRVAYQIVNGQDRNVSIKLLNRAGAGQYRSMICQADGLDGFTSGGGYHANSTDWDGFTLFPASGNITGTIRLYGMKI